MLEPIVQPADILFTAGSGFFSRAIRWATRHRGEEATMFSHVGIFTEEEPMGRASLVEATQRVTVSRIDDEYRNTGVLIAIARPLTLTAEERDDLSFDAVERIGQKYGWFKILGFFGDALLSKIFGGDPTFFRRMFLLKSRPVCSQLVAELYEKYGYGFGVPGGHATPDQIWDFVVSHPKRYKIIYGPAKI